MKPKDVLNDLIALDEANKGRFPRSEVIAGMVNKMHWKNRCTPRLDEWHRLYESGMTLAQVAEESGCSTTTVWDMFAKYGYPLRSRGRRVKRGVG